MSYNLSVATDSIITGDLDSTLANLASNLDISPAHRNKQQATTLSQMSSAKQMTAGVGAGWSPDFSVPVTGQTVAVPGAATANPTDMIFSDLFSTTADTPASTAAPVSNATNE
ncbi:phosphatidylinositol-binding clathrin assembly protein LAP-like [Tropilaelaps mercedesae]|uniref:Phosphatidylinositol-binding clathrin assembly protein LAP-like n=1 Tax=Tropilaelaps mercedesae TaxID=418985 RepID=A0A1V9Y335_9ACAR|nr:phosphatidylinositol-binding clathrin assembly protein LAP-like [Tropilaelaps mercedesae]